MTSGRLDPEMIKDMAKIMNEAIKGKVQVNLVINNRAGGNAPLIGGGGGWAVETGGKEEEWVQQKSVPSGSDIHQSPRSDSRTPDPFLMFFLIIKRLNPSVYFGKMRAGLWESADKPSIAKYEEFMGIDIRFVILWC